MPEKHQNLHLPYLQEEAVETVGTSEEVKKFELKR